MLMIFFSLEIVSTILVEPYQAIWRMW